MVILPKAANHLGSISYRAQATISWIAIDQSAANRRGAIYKNKEAIGGPLLCWT